MRIQKIGNHYRAFQRKSPNWKGKEQNSKILKVQGNVGNMSVLEDLEMNDRYKLWIDECSKLFGGLSICALDLLVRIFIYLFTIANIILAQQDQWKRSYFGA